MDDAEYAEALQVLGPDMYVSLWVGRSGERRIYLDDLTAGMTLATYFITGNLYRNAGAWDLHRPLLRSSHDEGRLLRYCEGLAGRHSSLFRLSTSSE